MKKNQILTNQSNRSNDHTVLPSTMTTCVPSSSGPTLVLLKNDDTQWVVVVPEITSGDATRLFEVFSLEQFQAGNELLKLQH